MKRARDIMNKRVVYFSPADTILHVSKCLAEYNISGAPIVENGRLAGIISNTDIIKFVNRKLSRPETGNSQGINIMAYLSNAVSGDKNMKGELRKAMDAKVGEIMTKDVKYVDADSDISEVTELITRLGINRLPVVDRGKLVGIITRDDLLKAFLAEG